MQDQTEPRAAAEGSTGPVRAVRQGEFSLPCGPATALPLFTPEGERRWVEGWNPEYLSGATDEVGAVWRTSLGADTTWVTTDRDDDRVRYAPDAARYADLVAGTHATEQPGNDQTERDVVVGARTVRVVRTVFPTNPTAGVSLTATLLDEGSRGRVRLEVHRTNRIDGYDEQSVAADLLAFVDG